MPDKRTGQNIQYALSDIVLSAFAVFFLQCPSFLARQQALQQRWGRSNAQTVFQIARTPCDAHIRQMLDPIAPPYFQRLFRQLLSQVTADPGGARYRVLHNRHILISLNGTEYFSSYHIHCPHCL